MLITDGNSIINIEKWNKIEFSTRCKSNLYVVYLAVSTNSCEMMNFSIISAEASHFDSWDVDKVDISLTVSGCLNDVAKYAVKGCIDTDKVAEKIIQELKVTHEGIVEHRNIQNVSGKEFLVSHGNMSDVCVSSNGTEIELE